MRLAVTVGARSRVLAPKRNPVFWQKTGFLGRGITHGFLRGCLWAATVFSLSAGAGAVEHFTLRQNDNTVHVAGKVVTEAVDGGLLILDREGVMWAVQPDELVKRASDETPYQPLQGDQLQRRLLEQLPAGFQIRSTAHYLVCFNTSAAYADWCGALFERLYRAFQNYWSRRGLTLHDPAMPLITVIFDRQDSYNNYAKTELGAATANIVAYYSLKTNRVTMYDLTGSGGLQGAGSRLSNSAQINRLLMEPGAEQMVATIVHEATHQLAYNCGMHARFADIPLWVSEGVAVYFETPDLRNPKGWGTIGGVNRLRLARFQQYARNRDRESLPSLLSDDSRFRKPATALDAYAEAWSLNYFLIRQKPKEYVQFLQQLAERKPMLYDTPDERLAAFRTIFGDKLPALDADFLRYMNTVR